MYTAETCSSEFGAQLKALRKELHENPELSMEEFNTTSTLLKLLARLPVEIVPLDTPTGVVALLRGAHPGKTVAIRGDMDALPVFEDAGNPIRSRKDGVMHACGHDMHTVFTYGAALVLSRLREELKGNVVFVFQPAEENIAGARAQISGGLFDKLHIDYMIGGHVSPSIPLGSVGIRSGAFMSAKDSFEITITGRGGHGAHPHLSHDPIVAGAAVISALQTIASRNNSTVEPGVLSICSVHGGSADNIIPESLSLLGSMRTSSASQREMFKTRIKAISENVAAGFECTAQVSFHSGVPVLMNDDSVTEICRSCAISLLGKDNVTLPPLDLGSEDFALFAERVLSCFMWIGAGDPGKPLYPLHHPRFFPPDETIFVGASLYANAAMALMG